MKTASVLAALALTVGLPGCALAQVLPGDSQPDMAAVKKLTDQMALAKVVTDAKEPTNIRYAAAGRITDLNILRGILPHGPPNLQYIIELRELIMKSCVSSQLAQLQNELRFEENLKEKDAAPVIPSNPPALCRTI